MDAAAGLELEDALESDMTRGGDAESDGQDRAERIAAIQGPAFRNQMVSLMASVGQSPGGCGPAHCAARPPIPERAWHGVDARCRP